jgi:biopolymer transport protein TolQ
MLFANSLIDGYFYSNAMGRAIVLVQIGASIVMTTAIIGKIMDLNFVRSKTRRFKQLFSSYGEIIGYYRQYRPTVCYGLERIYKETCERFLRIANPGERSSVAAGQPSFSLSLQEIELLRGTCYDTLDKEVMILEKYIGVIATVVSIAPMFGLLGTVWGVLDAFAEMGTAGSANLATIAPAISSALVTTVVGLLVAFPGVIAYNWIEARIREYVSVYENFCEELISRFGCEYLRKEGV